MPRKTFSADVADFADLGEQLMLDVMAVSLRDMVEDMQTPTGKGGRMRVDTGFLRNSGLASLSGLPSGESEKPADAPVGQYTGIFDTFDGTALNAVLLDMKLGDTFYWGWVAGYAGTREVYDGFMDTAIQNWQGYVNTAVGKARDG